VRNPQTKERRKNWKKKGAIGFYNILWLVHILKTLSKLSGQEAQKLIQQTHVNKFQVLLCKIKKQFPKINLSWVTISSLL
jgi:hypothetical protein